MTDQEKVVEVQRDYSAVNRYVDHLLDRHQDSLAYNHVNRWKLVLWGVGILLIAVALAYYIYSWAVYIQKKEPLNNSAVSPIISEQTKTENVKQITTNLIEANNEKPVDQPYEVKKVSVEFTVFKKVDLTGDRKIVTGYSFEPSNIETPKYQYCYLDILEGENTTRNVMLASKQGISGVQWRTNIDKTYYGLGQSHCHFRFD